MFEDEGYKLIGAAFEVFNQLGYGMAEEIYHQSLEIELALRGIPYVSKQPITATYKGHQLETFFKPDLIVSGGMVVELKAVSDLVPEHEAQLFNYMRIINHPVGYLVNFGQPNALQWKRYILSDLRGKN